MAKNDNNPPFAELQLDQEMADFLMENASINIRTGLTFLNQLQSRDLAEKMIKQIDGWRKLRDMLRLANPSIRDDY